MICFIHTQHILRNYLKSIYNFRMKILYIMTTFPFLRQSHPRPMHMQTKLCQPFQTLVYTYAQFFCLRHPEDKANVPSEYFFQHQHDLKKIDSRFNTRHLPDVVHIEAQHEFVIQQFRAINTNFYQITVCQVMEKKEHISLEGRKFP